MNENLAEKLEWSSGVKNWFGHWLSLAKTAMRYFMDC